MQQQPPPYGYNPQPMQHLPQYPPGYVLPQPVYPPQQPPVQHQQHHQQQQQQQQQQVVVVSAPAPAPTTTVIRERSHVNHILHLIITCFFPPWIIVWIILTIAENS
ncbi:alpha/beta-gliadin A-II-like [Haliotis rubra]|uniref:alpha/beta-gliadin A-II-like n=1 Tax=Haliotis rubra TaxID=36100 RepID=UPI001EE6218B|nr:alpha/beta-gliadin A-II-like [Haliotis rubra]